MGSNRGKTSKIQGVTQNGLIRPRASHPYRAANIVDFCNYVLEQSKQGGGVRKLTLLILFCCPLQGFAQVVNSSLSIRTHIYAVEYLKPIRNSKTNMKMVSASFFVRVSPQTAEAIIRSEIERIVKFFPVESDGLMAMADYYPNDDSLGEAIYFPDGSKFILFSPKTKKIETEKQHYGPGGIHGYSSKKMKK
jgi:hypothetical protein